jgi:hypothetical protein
MLFEGSAATVLDVGLIGSTGFIPWAGELGWAVGAGARMGIPESVNEGIGNGELWVAQQFGYTP